MPVAFLFATAPADDAAVLLNLEKSMGAPLVFVLVATSTDCPGVLENFEKSIVPVNEVRRELAPEF